MKVKLLAAMIAILALCSVVTAQGYDIRTTSRNNLRAAPSLDGTFLETVPAGTVLHVVGRLNRWLRISRNGREVWMADWVGYRRVESSAGAAPQPVSNVPAQVDNCCFVDRQCATDADWTAGWHAFQNGQCAAPAQSQPQQTSTQPVSNVPAQVDNCCFVDWQCHTPADWENGYYAFRDGQCPAPAQSQPQTPTQPVRNIPANVDNCCFVDRQCHTPADWENGYYAFRDNQCPASAGAQQRSATVSSAPSSAAILLSTRYMTEGVRRFLANPTSDPFNNCCHMRYQNKDCSGDGEWEAGYYAFLNGQCIPPWPLGTRPAIVGNDTPLGTAKFTKLANTALELIGIHAPEWLRYIDVSGVRQFRLFSAGGLGGGFFNRGWIVGHGWTQFENDDPVWAPDFEYIVGYAGGITHEACHAIQQRTYSQSEGWTNEAACVEAQLAVIEAIDPDHKDVGWLRDLVANIQNPDRWWW